MDIAAVRLLFRVLVIGVVVELPHLVPAVQHRDAALGEHPGVEHEVAGDGPLQLEGVLLIVGGLHTAQGGGGAAQAGVPQPGVVVVELPPAVAARPLAGEPVVEVLLVGHLVGAEVLLQPGVIQPPADVVVAAQVIEKEKVPGQGAHRIHLVAEEGHVPVAGCARWWP